MKDSELKKQIKEIIVVEGKSDTDKLKKLFDVQTIETNGSALNKQTINLIKKVSERQGVILFLDPDQPGERVRKQIVDHLIQFKQAFIPLIHQKKKIGIAETDDQLIIKALEQVATYDKNNKSLTWQEYLELDLNNKNKRLILTNKLNISYCNHKQLFKRLNMLSLDQKAIKKLLCVL